MKSGKLKAQSRKLRGINCFIDGQFFEAIKLIEKGETLKVKGERLIFFRDGFDQPIFGAMQRSVRFATLTADCRQLFRLNLIALERPC